MSHTQNLVEVHDLSIHFGGIKAVSNVNFNLGDGELRCLIGPNGAGKTTFFRLLTGVHKPTYGTVSINGKAIKGLQTHEIALLGVGIKTQIPSLFDELTVRENLWISARRHNKGKAAEVLVERALDDIEMVGLSDAIVSRLSHGQRQWVELGVVIASNPKLILLDEPAAGMTTEEIKKTAKLIKKINERCSMIVVEHDMEFIKMIAKTVTVFNRGEILMEDTVEAVLKDQRVRDVYLGKQANTGEA
jgi:branched-chain amino acid transport system ATP-binding protein